MPETVTLANGTAITVGDDWCQTVLPCGTVVNAKPNADSPAIARELGYGDDVAAMTRDHDALHSKLCDWLGLPHSYSLMVAAGKMSDGEPAWHEEAAVLAIQKLLNAVRS